jgi:hypothetical protein
VGWAVCDLAAGLDDQRNEALRQHAAQAQLCVFSYVLHEVRSHPVPTPRVSLDWLAIVGSFVDSHWWLQYYRTATLLAFRLALHVGVAVWWRCGGWRHRAAFGCWWTPTIGAPYHAWLRRRALLLLVAAALPDRTTSAPISDCANTQVAGWVQGGASSAWVTRWADQG